MFTTPPNPDSHGVCAACDGALSASEPDGYWLLEGQAWHAGCAPWGRHGFPYAWALRSGVRLRGLLRRRGEASSSLDGAIAALEAAAGAWPPPDPAPVLREAGRAAGFVVRCERRVRERPL